MKKAVKITGIIAGSLLVLIIAALLIIPVAFKDKIRAKVEAAANEMLNAKVFFADYKLSLFRAFPDASFSLRGLSLTGVDRFEGDTLAAVGSFDLAFNIMSLFSGKGYEVRSIIIDKPLINAIVLEDGTANWDIMKETATPDEQPEETSGTSSFSLSLRDFRITNGRVSYSDRESKMAASITGLAFSLSGNMSSSQSDLLMDLSAEKVSLVMDKIKYLNSTEINFHSEIDARLDSMVFYLMDNSFSLNDIILKWSGMVAMPGEDIMTDLVFSAPSTDFKSLLSLVPAVYMEGFEELKTSGSFSLDGAVKGIYSAADSTIPGVSLKLTVNDGVISYPDLPEKISAININTDVSVDGHDMDLSTVNISKFHFELAGNPFDLTMSLATPVSDPAVNLNASGKIDLTKLQQAVPLDSVSLNGLIDISMKLAGRMSMIENKKYEQFRAEGALSISSVNVSLPDLPEVSISKASFLFTPAFSEMKQFAMKVGEKSDLNISGRLENYLPYLFSDGVLKGNLALASSVLDLNEIMDRMPTDTVASEDTTSLAVIEIPRNIDFVFNATIGKLFYDKLSAFDVKGNIIVRDGVVSVRETGMKAMGGTLLVNADYDTRDTLKPVVKADMKITSVGIREAFNTFNTIQRLAPAAAGLGGNVSAGLSFESLLGSDMMPVTASITGNGDVRSEMVQIVESKTFDQMKSVLKMKSDYSNVVRDVKASFSISDGRVYVKPFDTKLGNIKLNIAGDQGLDKTINYIVKTEIPRADLGESANALISGLTSQAGSLGIKYTPSDVIKVNLKVGGTFAKPVVLPVFTGAGESGSAAATVTTAVKEEATEAVREEVSDQAEKILREAEEQAQVVRDKAAASAKTIREEADLRAQKLIKDAEPKGTLAVLAAKKAAEALKKEADKKATMLETEANAKADKILAEAREKADAVSAQK